MFHSKFDRGNKIWNGVKTPPLLNPKISLGQVLIRSLVHHGSKVAQISDDIGKRFTFDEIRIKTVRAAQNLQKNDRYQPKDVFAIMAKNSEHVAPIVIASFCLGCPVNTMDASFGKTETLHMFNITKPRVVFCDVEIYKLVSECLNELRNDAKVYTFGGQAGDSEAVENLFCETGIENDFAPVNVDGENDIAAILCSSGTTGLPKGVALSHAAFLDQITQIAIVGTDDISLCFSSLYWVTGFNTLIWGTFIGATRVITKQGFSPELELRLIEKYNVSMLINAPYHVSLLLKCDALKTTNLSSVKYFLFGGGKLGDNVQAEMKEHLPNGQLYNIYGMSEVAGIISSQLMAPNRTNTAGQLMNGVTAKITDDDGNHCGVGIDGEVCVKLNYKFLGYYGNQAATNEAIDEEGFLMTGDIGHFDEDGFLYIVDRKKDLLKYRGFQISPSEIEAFITTLPGIKSVCVVGITDEDGVDLPAGVIVRKSDGISENEVFDAVADHFADHSKLRGGVYFVDSLPLTASGKILRRAVKEIALKFYGERKIKQ